MAAGGLINPTVDLVRLLTKSDPPGPVRLVSIQTIAGRVYETKDIAPDGRPCVFSLVPVITVGGVMEEWVAASLSTDDAPGVCVVYIDPKTICAWGVVNTTKVCPPGAK